MSYQINHVTGRGTQAIEPQVIFSRTFFNRSLSAELVHWTLTNPPNCLRLG
jgi:hypothetical protein